MENYVHPGQVGMMLSMHEGLGQGCLTDGNLMGAIAAGIGYAWGATLIHWGPGRRRMFPVPSSLPYPSGFSLR